MYQTAKFSPNAENVQLSENSNLELSSRIQAYIIEITEQNLIIHSNGFGARSLVSYQTALLSSNRPNNINTLTHVAGTICMAQAVITIKPL